MSRWFRVYDDLVDDPKVQRLPAELVKALLNLWCLASKNGGLLPSVDEIAFKLRMKGGRVDSILDQLRWAGLIDDDETGTRPHNWNGRQFKSDVSNERVKRFRERTCNVTETVTVTPPETEADTDTKQIKNSEANASAADASSDPRTRLFNEGLRSLAEITGRTPDSCRSLVGRWLKLTNDEAVHVLGAIEDAARNRVADPTAWITKVLTQRDNRNGRMEAAANPRSVLAALDRVDERRRSAHQESEPSVEADTRVVLSLPQGRLR